MALIAVEQTEAFIYVTITVESAADRNLGQKAAAAARKIADGKIYLVSSGGSFIDGVDTRIYTYSRGPAKADLAAERTAKAEVELAVRERAEVEREWEKIERLGGGRHTTAWNCMGSAEENADDTAGEEGFERLSDRWFSMVASSYSLEDNYSQYGELAYTRNIDDDITNGVMEEV